MRVRARRCRPWGIMPNGGKVASPQATVAAEKKSRGWPFPRDNRDYRDERDRDGREERDKRDGVGNCAAVALRQREDGLLPGIIGIKGMREIGMTG